MAHYLYKQATPNTVAGLKEQNRELRAEMERRDKTNAATISRLRQALKPRRPDDYTPTTPEALERATQRVRAAYPEPDTTKNQRLLTLDWELRQFQRHGRK